MAKENDFIPPGPSAPFLLDDEAAEAALISGTHEDLLKRQLGEENFRELQQLAREAQTRAFFRGPRVLILPGIMGSKLGTPRALIFNNVIWIDPVDIALGRLATLSLIPGPRRHDAVGVMLFAYLKLKLNLRLAGYNADFFPFDWRLDLKTLGKQLLQRLANDSADGVHLVAHSMGGLVARAALKEDGKKIKQLIMLGTPNYGSFAPLMAIRGTHSVVRWLARVDVKHSAGELSTRIFNTFPGLYQLMPAPEKTPLNNFTELSSWPSEGPRPREQLLREAAETQNLLAPPDDRFVLIAGVNRETAVEARIENGQFVYSFSLEGDETVPLVMAELPNTQTYYVEAGHGSLPNNSQVLDAVKDLLARGRTNALAESWARRNLSRWEVTEEELRRAIPERPSDIRGAAISDEEMRQILEPFASPEGDEEPLVAPSEIPSGFEHSFQAVTVSRRRHRSLEIRLALGSITEARARACVLGLFKDVTPAGPAQAIDAQMNGAITEFSQRRMFSGNAGEVFLFPTSGYALRPQMVVFAGLGGFDQFTPEVLEVVAENVIRTLVRTGVEDFSTVLMGAGSGQMASVALAHLLKGFCAGLLESDTDRNFRRVTLCELERERYQQIKEELYRLASTTLCEGFEMIFDEVVLPAPPAVRPVERLVPATTGKLVYLLVREERGGLDRDSFPEYVISLLTSGGKATVITQRRLIDPRQIEARVREIETPAFRPGALQDYGQRLADLMLGSEIQQALENLQGHSLVLVHDARTSRIPWETLSIRGWQPALRTGMVRRYLAENLSVAKWLEERRFERALNILLVADPTLDLPGAEEERRRLVRLFTDNPFIRLTVRSGREATKPVLYADFRSGAFDVLHYAGHAHFDSQRPASSGILCADGQVLSGRDLAGLSKLPALVFFNACESGRLRSSYAKDKRKLDIEDRIERNVSLAEAFLRGGVANYIGTFWPVQDASAKRFGLLFYEQLLSGATLGEAILKGRNALENLPSVDWADYILYGSPDFVLKETAGPRSGAVHS